MDLLKKFDALTKLIKKARQCFRKGCKKFLIFASLTDINLPVSLGDKKEVF